MSARSTVYDKREQGPVSPRTPSTVPYFASFIDLSRTGACRLVMALILLAGASFASRPAAASAEGCATISSHGIDRQMNLHASEILVKCGAVPAGSATGGTESPLAGAASAFPGSDVDVITGTETYPHVTQSESFVWSHGQTVVVSYNDSRGSAQSPPNYSGVSVSQDGGATFARLGSASPFTGHGANYGDPIVVYDQKLGNWFAGDLVGGCGGQGIGLWTSADGEAWSLGACAHSGAEDDRESMWVDNNAGSPYYGRMYISFNNFSVGGGALMVTHSDNGTSWSTPVAVYSSFRRDVQLTGSPGSDGSVFLAAQNENGGGVGNTGQQNYMYRSVDGGVTWTSAIVGPTFTIPGSKSCGYFPAIPPIWRGTGWGQPAVGPNGVVQYVYAAHGAGSDESDIFYVRSTDNGSTWSAPIRLNTDNSGSAQWMPSLRVTPGGVVEASWYDRRNTSNGENYQRFARISTDNGATWGPDEPLSTVLIPQPTQPDPNVQACYAGDYNYTTATASTGFDTWTDGRVPVEGHQVQKVFAHGIPLTKPARYTALCRSAEGPCVKAWPAETEFTATSVEVLLEVPKAGTPARCEAALNLKTSQQAGEPLQASLTSLTWSNCSGFKKVETTVLPSASVALTGDDVGTLELTRLEGVMREGPLGATCNFTMTNAKLSFTGGSGTAQLSGEDPLAVSGFGCGSTGTFTAGGAAGGKPFTLTTAREPGKESATSPPVFPEERAVNTALCRLAERPCTNAWPAETEFTATSVEVLLEVPKAGTPARCEAALNLKTSQQAGEPLQASLTSLTWSNCSGFKKVETTLLPNATLNATGGGSAMVRLTKIEGIMREGPLGATCNFTMTNAKLSFTGGSGTAQLSGEDPLVVSGFGCGSSGSFYAGSNGGKAFTVISAKESGKEAILNPPVFGETGT